jgi:hypothetical protein
MRQQSGFAVVAIIAQPSRAIKPIELGGKAAGVAMTCATYNCAPSKVIWKRCFAPTDRIEMRLDVLIAGLRNHADKVDVSVQPDGIGT